MGQCSIKEGGNSMWHQRLPWVSCGLIAVMVIAGSLALLSCSSDDNGTPAGLALQRSVTLDPATVRANVNSTNIGLLTSQDIIIDAAAFAFDISTGGGSASGTLRITNVRSVTLNPNVVAGASPVPNGPPPTSPQVNPPFTTTA